MDATENQKDRLLKRIQLTLAILTGVASLAVALYNIKAYYFSDKRPGHILVTVISDDQRGMPAVRAEVINAQGAIVLTGVTDPEGQVEMRGLPPGGYTIKAAAGGFEPQIVTVQVGSGKTTDAAVLMRRLPMTAVAGGGAIRSAIEEVGASWIKRLGEPAKSGDAKPAETSSGS